MGSANLEEARRLVDICIDAGANLFDTADVYSQGASEEILGEVLKGRREKAIISTKVTMAVGGGPNERGSSRLRVVRAVDAALKRLDTDYIDVLHMHAYDQYTPIEEVTYTLDQLVRDGKVRYLGASNFGAWHLMKSLAAADRHGSARYVSHQVHYSLLVRDYEWELMPLGMDQGVGAIIWSPLSWARLTGKIKRGKKPKAGTRMAIMPEYAPPVEKMRLYRVYDALDQVAEETGRPHTQVAMNWLLSRPSVTSVIIGARNEEQLKQNLGATTWKLSAKHIKLLNEASYVIPAYPHFSYLLEPGFNMLNPPPVT